MTEPSPAPVSSPVLSAPVRPATPVKPITRPARLSLLAKMLITIFALAALVSWAPWFLPRLAQRLPAGLHQEAQTDSVSRAEFEVLKAQALVTLSASPQVDTPNDNTALAAQLADLQKQLADTKTQLAQQQQLASTIKGDSAREALNAVAPLFTLNRLADKLARGLACQLELDAAGAALNASERASIAPLAGGGASPDSLVAQLNTQRRDLLAVWRDANATGWWEKIRARLSALVSISAPGQAPDMAAVAYDKLRAQIAQGDDAGALATLRALPADVQAGLTGLADALDARARALEAVSAAMARHAPVAADKTPSAS